MVHAAMATAGAAAEVTKAPTNAKGTTKTTKKQVRRVVEAPFDWAGFLLETIALSLFLCASLYIAWIGTTHFEDWDHMRGYLSGRLDMDGYIRVDPSEYTVYLSQEDINEGRFTPPTLTKIKETLAHAGMVHVTGGSIWTDEQLDELDNITFRELELQKRVALERGLLRAPWNLAEWAEDHEYDQDELYEKRWAELEASDICADCVKHVRDAAIHDAIATDPMIFPKDNFSYGDAVSISYGRVDMPHFLNFTTFQRLPYYNRSDMNEICEHYNEGQLCETTLAGALWNFPGSSSSLWHQDSAEDGHYEDMNEVMGTLTTAIASRTLPVDVGWIEFQPLTHSQGAWSHLPKDQPPNVGEPESFTLPLARGEMVIFADTTKHTVTPNPTNVDRGIVYVLYGSQEWVDTPWHGTGTLVPAEIRQQDPLWNGPIDSRRDI